VALRAFHKKDYGWETNQVQSLDQSLLMTCLNLKTHPHLSIEKQLVVCASAHRSVLTDKLGPYFGRRRGPTVGASGGAPGGRWGAQIGFRGAIRNLARSEKAPAAWAARFRRVPRGYLELFVLVTWAWGGAGVVVCTTSAPLPAVKRRHWKAQMSTITHMCFHELLALLLRRQAPVKFSSRCKPCAATPPPPSNFRRSCVLQCRWEQMLPPAVPRPVPQLCSVHTSRNAALQCLGRGMYSTT
jgi:hypothetical protein